MSDRWEKAAERAEVLYRDAKTRMKALFKQGVEKPTSRRRPFRGMCVEMSGLMLGYAIMRGWIAQVVSVWITDSRDGDYHHDVLVVSASDEDPEYEKGQWWRYDWEDDMAGDTAWVDGSSEPDVTIGTEFDYDDYEQEVVSDREALLKVAHLMPEDMRAKLGLNTKGNPMRNSDERRRALERLAASGDAQAAEQLAREELRQGLREERRAFLIDIAPEASVVAHAAGVRAVLHALGALRFFTVQVGRTETENRMRISVFVKRHTEEQKFRELASEVFGIDIDALVKRAPSKRVGRAAAKRLDVFAGKVARHRRSRKDPELQAAARRVSKVFWGVEGDHAGPFLEFFIYLTRKAEPPSQAATLPETWWPIYKAGVERGSVGKLRNGYAAIKVNSGDEELRALERVVAASPGSTEARARLLAARLRRGMLDPWLVRAAASLGHESAVLVGLPKLGASDFYLSDEDRAERRRRRWDLAHNDDTHESYLRGLLWYEEPHETGPEDDDGLGEPACDLRARRRVLDDARRGDRISVVTLLILRGYMEREGALNPEYPLVLLEAQLSPRAATHATSPLADEVPGVASGFLPIMTLEEYRGREDEEPDIGRQWAWSLARVPLKRAADLAMLMVADEFLGLPVIRRPWPEGLRDKLHLWFERPRTVWWELVPKKLREAVGSREVDPATATDEELRLTSYAWPGGYEIYYEAWPEGPRGEVSVVCHDCANRSAEPWTLKRWHTNEGDMGAEPVRCDGEGCGRVLVPSERAWELNIANDEFVTEPAGENVRCADCNKRFEPGTEVVSVPSVFPDLVFCDEACARERIAHESADEDEDA